MAYIRSANQSNFTPIEPLDKPVYVHGADTRRHFIPMAFQVTSPYDETKALLPHALISHVNPSSFAETFNKKVERAPTRGGYVEWHWGDDLTEVSAEQSTGAFVNLYTGLSSLLRQRTIAWDRYRDLYDLYRNNGSLYKPDGAIVRQGWILLMYDRGTYVGTFRNFSVEETDESPFAFRLSWTFKVERIIQQIPQNSQQISKRLTSFQTLNTTTAAIQPRAQVEDIPPTSLLLMESFQAPIKDPWASSGGFSSNHAGLDLRAPIGTPLYPMATGRVTRVGVDPEGGNVVYIEHPDGIKTYYAHLDSINVQVGDEVSDDTQIGTVGKTGNAADTWPHCHFQVSQDGKTQDPAAYFTVPPYTQLTPEEKAHGQHV